MIPYNSILILHLEIFSNFCLDRKSMRNSFLKSLAKVNLFILQKKQKNTAFEQKNEMSQRNQ